MSARPRRRGTARTCLILLLGAMLGGGSSITRAQTPAFDLVVSGGRVIDPESGLDARREIGIRGDRIARISEEPLAGAKTIDASGLVVAPGFIDLHTHSPTPLGQAYQLLDGVTTALELEGGAYPIEGFAEAVRDRARIHYGTSAGFGSIRIEAMLGIRQAHLLTSKPEPIGLMDIGRPSGRSSSSPTRSSPSRRPPPSKRG